VLRGPFGRCQTLASSPPSKWHEAQELLKLPEVCGREASSKSSSPRICESVIASGPMCVGIWSLSFWIVPAVQSTRSTESVRVTSLTT
jgi:hypothetical protein